MAALFWLLLFAYGCTIVYAPKGSGQLPAETLLRKKTVFHLIAWALPFILLLMILLLGEIDGDSLYGICFVGFASSRHFVFFVLVPVTGALGAFLYFMGLAVVQLWLMMRFNMQTDKNPTRCALKCRKIWRVILRMLLGVLWSLVAYITAIIIYIYQQSYNREYARQLNQYIVCNLNISNALEPKENGSFLAASAANNNLDLPYSDSYDGFGQPNPSPCQALAPKPVLWPLHLQLAIIFGNVILAFTWISTYSTWRSWKHFLEKRFNKEYYMQNRERLKRLRQEEAAEQDVDELQKTVVGQTETKRQRLGLASGMLTSFASFTSRHWDPVEMELSSFNSYSWTASIKEKIYPLFGGRVSQNGSHSRAAAAAGQAPVTSITSNTLGTSTVDVSSDQNSSVTLGHSVESSSLAAAEAKNVPSNTEGRRRKSRKKFMRLKRRGSDTSGSILSAAFVTIPKSRLADHSRLVTKSTSTGDLVVLQTPSGAQLNMVSSLTPTIPPGGPLNLPPFATLPLSPFLPSPGLIAALQQQNSTSAQQAAPPLGPSMPFSHNLAAFANGQAATMPSVLRPPGLFQSNMLQRPQMVSQPAAIRAPAPAVPTSHIPPRRSVAHASHPPQSTFTFTHGFSEQSPKELINPFTEKRRPDSSLSSSNNTNNTNFIVQRATNNLATRSPHLAAGAHNQMISQAVAASASAPQHQLAQLYQAAAAGSSATLNQLSALSAMASIGSHNLSPYHLLASPWTAMNGTVYNTKLALEYLDQIQQQSMTPAEYAALVQEREALKSLVTGRSSAASSNNGPLIPTLMSDSEFSTYSDASRASQYPELSAAQVKAIQREVDERLHKVEQKETEAARGRQHPVGKEVTASSKGKKKQQQQQQSKSKSKVKNKRGKKDQDLENPEDRDGQPDLGKDTEEDSGTAVQ